ncbi:hypothetical protein CKO_04231 [Citrobacter koseri ATCC BAA-895]|uniref:Uncharacterized protein n=1 Tax=Citrobacter koseri (strain ATCC BAA-895 / CDC 4225-83 / SGSC4696) TaxID=290338 RepID=A8AP78_CITK8|nr:hypothetical protein CKO_04231 [Citrobacter koseri ATCC BAA-895]
MKRINESFQKVAWPYNSMLLPDAYCSSALLRQARRHCGFIAEKLFSPTLNISIIPRRKHASCEQNALYQLAT